MPTIQQRPVIWRFTSNVLENSKASRVGRRIYVARLWRLGKRGTGRASNPACSWLRCAQTNSGEFAGELLWRQLSLIGNGSNPAPDKKKNLSQPTRGLLRFFGCKGAGVAPRAALDLNLRSRLPPWVLLPGGERSAPTEPAVETGAWTVATGDQAPSGYEGWLAVTYRPVGPFPGVLAGGFRKTYPT